MKNTTLNIPALAFMVCLFLTPSVAQAQISFGIRVGANATNVSVSNLPNKGERFGYHLGVFTELPISADFMTLQPEISYSVKGTSFKPLTTKQTLIMNYVDLFLPIAFKLSAFDLQIGPYASYLTSTPDYTVYSDNKLVVNGFKKYDVGLTGGLAYNFNKIFVGVRYNQGFVDVTTDNSRPFLGKGKNAVAQISLGYKF